MKLASYLLRECGRDSFVLREIPCECRFERLSARRNVPTFHRPKTLFRWPYGVRRGDKDRGCGAKTAVCTSGVPFRCAPVVNPRYPVGNSSSRPLYDRRGCTMFRGAVGRGDSRGSDSRLVPCSPCCSGRNLPSAHRRNSDTCPARATPSRGEKASNLRLLRPHCSVGRSRLRVR